jgi:hypothetical protein
MHQPLVLMLPATILHAPFAAAVVPGTNDHRAAAVEIDLERVETGVATRWIVAVDLEGPDSSGAGRGRPVPTAADARARRDAERPRHREAPGALARETWLDERISMTRLLYRITRYSTPPLPASTGASIRSRPPPPRRPPAPRRGPQQRAPASHSPNSRTARSNSGRYEGSRA